MVIKRKRETEIKNNSQFSQLHRERDEKPSTLKYLRFVHLPINNSYNRYYKKSIFKKTQILYLNVF